MSYDRFTFCKKCGLSGYQKFHIPLWIMILIFIFPPIFLIGVLFSGYKCPNCGYIQRR